MFASRGVEHMTGTAFDLTDRAFAPIRARLARAYMEHKADLGVPDASDDDVLRNVDDITLTLMRGVGQAILQGDEAFLKKYRWFTAIVEDLLGDVPDRLDG
jgi:hypothetical protein